jgi:hypothetical protein
MVAGIRRYLPPDTRIVCLTDRPELMPAGVEPVLLTEDHPGWWSKMWMFRRDVTAGRCCYIDLDNVLAGKLNDVIMDLWPDPMVMLDDRVMPGLPNSSFFTFVAERVRYIWDDYVNPSPAFFEFVHAHRGYRVKAPVTTEGIRHLFSEERWPHASDQGYMAAKVLEREGTYMPYFQELVKDGDRAILNARYELEAGAPWERARLVFGSWEPKPHQSAHPFYAKHWRD